MKSVTIAVFTFVLGMGLTLGDAEARRLGGGGSSGMQRSVPLKRDAAPAPARPAQPAAQPGGQSRWLGPIAGLAAGIGLYALFSYLGLSEELANLALIALIVVAVFFVIRLLARGLRPQNQPQQYAEGPAGGALRHEARSLGAAARTTGASVSADFDADSFLRHAKLNFVRLQAAHDAGDIEDIRRFTPPEMFAEITLQIQERGGTPQKTEVVALDAELLDLATEFRQRIASVRFSGTIRETAGGAAEPFDEIWHITKPVDDSRNWAIAGIQQVGDSRS